MDFFQVVERRASMRSFLDKPLDPDLLKKVFKAINSAPSAGNQQAFEVYLVTRPEQKARLASASGDQDSIVQAPVVLVFCTHPARNAQLYGARGRDLYALQDATIACSYAQLSATALGLASVWVGAFDDAQVHQALGAPDGERPIAILPIGHPGAGFEKRPRRPLAELVHKL